MKISETRMGRMLVLAGMMIPGYVVLGRKNSNEPLQGVVEHSFSMDLSSERAKFFWTSKERGIDGLKGAKEYQEHFAERHPDMEFFIYDVHADDLPIIIRWDEWRDSNQPADTLSGVKDKFKARNPLFELKV